MIVSSRPLSPPSTIGRPVSRIVTASSQMTPHLRVAHPARRQRERAFVEPLHPARERQPGEQEQEDAERRDARLHRRRPARTPRARSRRRAPSSSRRLISSSRDAAPALERRDRHVDDQQREERGVGLRADRHRAVDPLDGDEARDPVREQVDERADRPELPHARRREDFTPRIVGAARRRGLTPRGMTCAHPGARERVGDPDRERSARWVPAHGSAKRRSRTSDESRRGGDPRRPAHRQRVGRLRRLLPGARRACST